MTDLIIPGPDGKPQFIGKEDPKNPPLTPRVVAACNHGKEECPHLQCPTCGEYFDYLIGERVQGCETCYDVTKDHPAEAENQVVDEIIPSGGE